MAECELCGADIEGTPFALSSLGEDPRILEVCQECAESEYVRLEYEGLDLEVMRDDYIEADRENLHAAIDEACALLEERGWTCEGLRLRARRRWSSAPEAPATQRFLVTIHYREPTYQRHRQVVRRHPYRGRFEVLATDAERAKQIALREFQNTAVQSSSGWIRQVVRVECETLGADVCTVTGEE